MSYQFLQKVSRRNFIKGASVFAVAAPALYGCAGALALKEEQEKTGKIVATNQGWMGAAAAPRNPSSKIRIVSESEPGEPLVVSGTIYSLKDSKPIEGITLFVYHTDARGLYNDQGNSRDAGPRLHGWMRTKSDGRYEFRTIKPASYPNSEIPMHIHATVFDASRPEYWIDSYWFEGDPFITPKQMAGLSGRGGGNSIISLKRDEQGVLRGVRDLRI